MDRNLLAVLGRDRNNWIINGDMRIAQRGDYTSPVTDSALGANEGAYSLDRWKTKEIGEDGSIQQVSVAQPPQLSGSKSIKIALIDDAFDAVNGASQMIEDYDLLAGLPVVVSAYVKSNTPYARLMLSDGVSSHPKDTTHPGDESWQRLVLPVTLSAVATQVQVHLWISSETGGLAPVTIGDYIEFTGVKVEIGTVPSPFIPRLTADEALLCKRYYNRIANRGEMIVSGYMYLGYSFFGTLRYPEMRIPPTAHISGQTHVELWGSWVNSTSAGIAESGTRSCRMWIVPAGEQPLNVGRAVWVEDVAGYHFSLDAEL